MKVETFSFGFGPRLFGFRSGETDFRFSAILFGGYVKMAGEQPGEENADRSAQLAGQAALAAADHRFRRSRHERGAGGGDSDRAVHGSISRRFRRRPIRSVGYVAPDGAAAKAGIREGDKVVQMDSVVNPTWEDVAMKELASAKRPLSIWVERDGKRCI